MTYHDRRFLVSKKATERRTRSRKALLDGVFSITLFPRSPSIKMKSVGDDWTAVGADIRKAMSDWESRGSRE